jgi:hypothetical protein
MVGALLGALNLLAHDARNISCGFHIVEYVAKVFLADKVLK